MGTQPDSTSGPEPEFLRTDARQRRNIVWLMVGLLVLAILFFFLGLPRLTQWVRTGSMEAALGKFAVVCYSVAALMLILTAWIAGYARRVFRSGQFPPPGTWVLKDTRLRRGTDARTLAWGAVAVAACCALLAIYAVVLPHRLHQRLLPTVPGNGAPLQSTP